MLINPYYATGLFLYSLKTSENQRFSDVFRRYRKRPVVNWILANLVDHNIKNNEKTFFLGAGFALIKVSSHYFLNHFSTPAPDKRIFFFEFQPTYMSDKNFAFEMNKWIKTHTLKFFKNAMGGQILFQTTNISLISRGTQTFWF